MKFRIFILSIFFYSLSLSGQTDHVLFIGNSFTMNHEMPNKFAQIVKSEGKSVYVDQLTRGGVDWKYHATNPNTYQKIKSEPWNYVVLQGKSFEPLLDSSTVELTTKKYGHQIVDSIKHYWPDAKIMLFMTWGYLDGMLIEETQESIDYFEMQRRLNSQYLSFANDFGVAVAPIGEVWRKIREENPDVNLYEADKFHQNNLGSFLTASSFYTMIYEEPVSNFEKLPYRVDKITSKTIVDKTREVILNSKYDWKKSYWIKEEDFSLFDYIIRKDSLYLDAKVPDDYKVKWKINGETIDKKQSIIIPLKEKDTFEISIIAREGVLRKKLEEEALFKNGKKLVPTE
ncbi:MAG: DUF4886 domain-containing protein [Brumimicrobium sp.]